ncbi:heterokaryon incompatibility protein-domain-containing protein [Xylariales sp. AK1849]|nr:heterokaryon incompatibility protein-domain-containing protein [Xylariales sp. AK1849]
MADVTGNACQSCLNLEIKQLTDQVNIGSETAQSWQHPYTHWPNPTVKNIQKTAAEGCLCCCIISDALTRFGLLGEVKACRAKELQAWLDSGSPAEAPLTGSRDWSRNLTYKVPQKNEEGYDDYYGGLTAVVSLSHRVYKKPFSTVLPKFGLEFNGHNSVKELSFELYTLPGRPSPWSLIKPRDHFSRLDSAENCLSLVQSWLQLSDQAFSPPSTKLPTRVLALRNETVRLVDSQGLTGRYTTLSHCWGADANDQPFTTTLSSELENRRSIPWPSLSKTFQDAIHITRSLGLDYIWIDSLCIIQDDREDWKREAGKMADVYSNSHLSIMNPRGSKPSSGCFTDRYLNWKTDFSAPFDEPLKTTGIANGKEFEIFARRAIQHHQPRSRQNWVEWLPMEHMFSRAWIFQEYILAPRLVFFGLSELVFVSKNGQDCECEGFDPARFPGKVRGNSFDREYFRQTIDPSQTTRPVGQRGHKLWRDVVEAYAYRDLTQESDRLPALSGLAKRFRGSSDDPYLAGLWESCLIADLAWFPVTVAGHDLSDQSLPQTTHSRPTKYRAPTWSWASVNSRIRFWGYAYDEKETTAVLETAFCETDSSDSTGSVTGGYMVVTGPVREAILRYDELDAKDLHCCNYWLDTDSNNNNNNNNDAKDLSSEEGKRRWWRTFTPDIPLHDPARETYIPTDGEVFCLQLGIRAEHGNMKRGSESVLVLTKMPESGHYRRIGYWILDREQYYQELGGIDSDQSWFDGCSRQSVTIE